MPPAGIAEVLAIEHDDDAPEGKRLPLAADDEFQPHSYYCDRYPMGREATLSSGAWGSPG